MKLWPFHHHRYFEVDRYWMESVWRNRETGETASSASPITLITERCADKSCGNYRQHTLKGHLAGGNFPGTRAAEKETVPNE